MARAAKDSEESRAGRLYVRLSAAERQAFADRAAAAGMTRSDYARRAVLAGRIVIKRTAEADPALIIQLQKIGVNLNQIARTANINGRAPDDLDRLCRTIEAFVLKAIEPEAVADDPDPGE